MEIYVVDFVRPSEYVTTSSWYKINRYENVYLSEARAVSRSVHFITRFESVTVSESRSLYKIQHIDPNVYDNINIQEQLYAGAVSAQFLKGLARRAEVEEVFLNHDNYSALILTASGNPIGTGQFTRMDLKIGDVTVTSTNAADAPIRWNKAGYALGEVRLYLGFEALEPGFFDAPLICYSTDFPNGAIWEKIRLLVYGEVEAVPLPIFPGDGLSISEYVNVSIH